MIDTKQARRDADYLKSTASHMIDTLCGEIDRLQAEITTLLAERDKLIAEWPGFGHGRPLDFDHGDYVVTRRDERRKFTSGVWAVRYTAGLDEAKGEANAN